VVVILVSAGLAMLCLFLFIESRAKDPLVGLGLFRNRGFTCAMAALFFFFLAMPLHIMIIPFYLMDCIKLSPVETGLLLSVIPAGTMIASPISGFFSDRFGPRWPSMLGAGAIAASVLCMLSFDLQTGIWAIISVLALLGIGTGIFQPPNNSSIMGAVEQEHFGAVSALIGASRQVAISIGMAQTGAVFSVRQSAYLDLLQFGGLEASQLLRHSIPLALKDVILMTFLMTLAVLVLSSMTPKTRASR
jgi:predicted MFS family arabinose efflux permease